MLTVEYKKEIAFIIIVSMVIGLLGIPIKEVNAEEITQEYVIVAENDKGYDNRDSTWYKDRTAEQYVIEEIE